MDESSCPSSEQLTDFLRRRLGERESHAVGSHVDSCPECQSRATSLSLALPDTGPLPPPSVGASQMSFELPAVGQTLGEYRLLEKLGEGGMGAVFKALHLRLEKPVALKMLRKGMGEDAQMIDRFEREMKAVGRLNHPNIIQAYDAREIDGVRFLVTELVDGWDLENLLRQRGPFPPNIACALLRQAAAGLQAAHEHGLVHRDIKPSNLMLTHQGQVKILDLGLARLQRAAESTSSLTSFGQVMGTADYMAPEQASDCHNVDIRADIYSLGCTLFRLVTGQVMFGGAQFRTHMEKMVAHLTLPAPKLRSRRDDLPEALETLLERMLAKKPSDRFATPAELIGALAPLAAGADLVAWTEGRASPESTPAPRPQLIVDHGSRRAMWLAAIVMLLAVAGVAGWSVYHFQLIRGPQPVAKRIEAPPANETKASVVPAKAVAEPPAKPTNTATTASLPPAAKTEPKTAQAKTEPPAQTTTPKPEAKTNPPAKTTPAETKPVETKTTPATQTTPTIAPATPQPASAAAPLDAAAAKQHQEAWSKYLGIGIEQQTPQGIKLQLIPPGEFVMGEADTTAAKKGSGANETAPHRVRITKPFLLGSYEITRAQYESVAKRQPSQARGEGEPAKLPVDSVSWSAAVSFCETLNQQEPRDSRRRRYRLPTEAEWEYACRAGSADRWPLGNDEAKAALVGWFQPEADGRAHAVGGKLPNAWGLYDMLGNVYEWCGDWYRSDYYAQSPAVDPPGPTTGLERVIRGGSWWNNAAHCRPAARVGSPPDGSEMIGLRIACDVALPSGFPAAEPAKTQATQSAQPKANKYDTTEQRTF